MSHHQELDQLTNYLRAHGRALKLGVPLKPPFLPRSKRMRQALEEEAANDHRIRIAIDAISAAEAAKPRVFRRHFTDAELRIY